MTGPNYPAPSQRVGILDPWVVSSVSPPPASSSSASASDHPLRHVPSVAGAVGAFIASRGLAGGARSADPGRVACGSGYSRSRTVVTAWVLSAALGRL